MEKKWKKKKKKKRKINIKNNTNHFRVRVLFKHVTQIFRAAETRGCFSDGYTHRVDPYHILAFVVPFHRDVHVYRVPFEIYMRQLHSFRSTSYFYGSAIPCRDRRVCYVQIVIGVI
jgi:hypothetical protein